MINKVKKRIDSVFLGTIAFMAIIVISVKFIALPNNLIFSDEGWYLCLLRDLPHFGATRFHLLFNNVFKNNIYAIRLACLLLQLLSSAFMAMCMAIWTQKYYSNYSIRKLTVLFFCATVLGQKGIEACPSFNYINLNKVCVEMGVGFLLLGLAKKKSFNYLLSGFMLAFLFPIMIPNVIVFPFVIAVVFLLSVNKVRDVIALIMGVFVFAFGYMVFVESPSQIIADIVHETENVVDRGKNDYGWLFYVNWMIDTVMYLSKWFFIALSIFGIYHLLIKQKSLILKNKYFRFSIIGALSTVILLYSWYYIPPVFPVVNNHLFTGGKDLHWVLLFLLILFDLIEKKTIRYEELIFSILLLIVPLTLSFGSNVSFYVRHGAYFVFITPLILYYSLKRSAKWKTIILCFFVFTFAMSIIGYFGKNWHGEKHFGHQVSVKTIGINQNVRLTNEYIEALVDCRNHIPPNAKILCSAENWGVVSLLNYTPICYDFNIDKNGVERIQKIVEETVAEDGHLWIIAAQDNQSFMDKLNSIKGYDMSVDTGYRSFYIYAQKSIK